MPDVDNPTLVEVAAEIIAAFVAHNAVPTAELPDMLAAVYRTLVELGRPAVEKKLVPPVPVKKSIADDFLVSLEDGRRYKTLKRHLAGLGMTPDEYRAKWGLPSDYPMVAPSYSRARSALAKEMGLGERLRKR